MFYVPTFREQKPLGEILIEMGAISREQLLKAQELQKKTGVKLSDALISSGICSPECVADGLAVQLGLERAPEAFWEKKPPQGNYSEIAVKYRVYPIKEENEKLYLAVSDPLDFATFDEIELTTRLKVVPMVATAAEIERALRRWYISGSSELEGDTEDEVQSLKDDASGPAVQLVTEIINGALYEGASDIHIEPGRNQAVVRYRIDGMLRDVMVLPKNIYPAVVSRIKVLSGMDIADRRLPQDGRIRIFDPKEVDFRVSTLPTTKGEAVVMRVLDKERTVPKLENLGYTGENLAKIRRAISMPYGLILLTGPTGSGKTTTLYAALMEIVSPIINVITVEDPPEYELLGVRQVAVNVKAGLTFASALRSILRQDPDVIMIGEIRDSETARIAVQAALTGHLVLSTLHTNDASSAPARLIDMGVEPYLVASSLLCVVGQRLVRTVCNECAEPYDPPFDSPVWGFLNNGHSKEGLNLRRGKGCPVCARTGYKGRTSVSEVMVVTRPIRELIRKNADSKTIRDVAINEGMVPMIEDARIKAVSGITTPEEAMRVAAFID